MTTTLVCWFRRDLRIHDQTALYHAAEDAEQVVSLFVVDPVLMAPPHGGGPRVRFLLESLRVLDDNLRALGGRLIVRAGDPVAVVLEVLRESGAQGVYVNRDYVAPGLERDQKVRREVEAAGFQYRDFADLTIVEPDALLTKGGTPYTVFTPYYRAWAARPAPEVLAAPRQLVTSALTTIPIPTAESLGWPVTISIARGGEDEGRMLLAQFTEGSGAPIHAYATARDLPGVAGTSRLSPHLRFGTVSVRTALAAAHAAMLEEGQTGGAAGPAAWVRELAWRDFYFAWMHHFPHVERAAFRREYDSLPYDTDDTLFAAWCAGQTGHPIVDAGMRQLNSEGWMHNRVRMITASFLCKDLLLDWRLGMDYFWQHLTCGDKPANTGGWQWSASIGTDAQPYFRVFNPVTQGQKHDPTGDYVRRYVPELTSLPDAYIHAPWTLPEGEARRLGFALGKTYPAPVVDHAAQRLRAIAIFEQSRTESWMNR